MALKTSSSKLAPVQHIAPIKPFSIAGANNLPILAVLIAPDNVKNILFFDFI